MYVSGTLKKKTVDFYREQMVDYSAESFDTPDFSIYYTGEIVTTPWNQEQLNKLEQRQEQIIRNGITKTYALIDNLNLPKSLKDRLRHLVMLINNTPRNMTVILFETYYEILKTVTSIKRLEEFENNMQIFINCLKNSENLSQSDIEFMVKRFKSHADYTDIDKSTLLNGVNLLYEQDQKLYNLAAFIANERIKKVSAYFNRGVGEDYPYLFLYFTLKDSNLANAIWEEHLKNPEKDLELVRVPKTLQTTAYMHNPE